MVYKTFLSTLTDQLHQALGDHHSVTIQKIPKNNGIILDGLCIASDDTLISPTIYLNSYYEQYQQGVPLSQIIDDIIEIYHTPPELSILDLCQINDFHCLQNKVVYKLIHLSSNQELLTELPYLPYLDMAIIFYLYLEETEHGQLTTLIHKKHQLHWQVTVEDLYRLASQNTPLLMPAQIRPMGDIMQEILNQQFDLLADPDMAEALMLKPVPDAPLYVLTNDQGLYGAACILYHSVLHHFASSIGSDLIILPSSIHEVLLIPHEESLCYQQLSEMVYEINHTEVPIEDRLSNQVYLYTLSNNQIHIASAVNSTQPIN